MDLQPVYAGVRPCVGQVHLKHADLSENVCLRPTSLVFRWPGLSTVQMFLGVCVFPKPTTVW